MDYWKALFTDGTRDADGNPDISASNTAAIVSILSAGTFFGSLSAAPFADSLGRRFALIASAVVFSFGVILQTAATAIPLFLAGRFFAGFGVGLVSALSMLAINLVKQLTNVLQFHYISLRRHRNGSVVLLWEHINWPSPLGFS